MRGYLRELPRRARLALEEILAGHDALLASDKKGVTLYRDLCDRIADLGATHLELDRAAVTIGRAGELSESDHERVRLVLRGFMPWRKGPFNIFGIEIDAEWQSNRKWERLQPVLPDLRGQVIADIGCNNGYYLFRMAAREPRLVLGFEPLLHHHFTFRTLNNLAGCGNLISELLGVEHLGFFADYFDVIFLMGILYHRISPVEVLRDCYLALKKGGMLLVESQAIPGEEAMALFPASTYAKAPGTWFVPTASCLANWLKRAGFDQTEVFSRHPMDDSEQRRTEWMTFESFSDFMDPADPNRTIEGYPAPWRVYVKAVK